MINKVLILLIVWLMSSSFLRADSKIWNGTANISWYDKTKISFEISSAEALAGLAELVDAGNDFRNKTIILTEDIILNENVLNENGELNNCNFKSWTPIGISYNEEKNRLFAGTFNGDGHVIKGLYIISEKTSLGLFAHVGQGGVVKNLGIEDSYCLSIKENQAIGMICGYNRGLIQRCYNSGIIVGETNYCNVGGICGFNENGTVEYCYNTGFIKGSESGGVCGMNTEGMILQCYNTGIVTGYNCAGGICGSLYDGGVRFCNNTGKIVGVGEYSDVGGICGRGDGLIRDCYNVNMVTGAYAGGICGSNGISGRIDNCENQGVVNDGENEGGDVGGICGRNQGAISICKNMNVVKAKYASIGGICGCNSGVKSIIKNCYNTESISVMGIPSIGGICGYNAGGTILFCHNIATLAAENVRDLGGICGYSAEGTISNCYNRGNLTGSSIDEFGGICGYSAKGTISNCYNTGALNGTVCDLGGICGYNPDGIINNCYNTGTQTGTANKVGGICGFSGATVNNSYNMGVVAVVGEKSGGVFGWNITNSVTNCGYLEGSSNIGIGDDFYELGIEAVKEMNVQEIINVMNVCFTTKENWITKASYENGKMILPTLEGEDPPTVAISTTSNEKLSNNNYIKAYCKDNCLYVYTPQLERVYVIDLNGTIIRSRKQSGLQSYEGLKPGVYLVHVNEKVLKILVTL